MDAHGVPEVLAQRLDPRLKLVQDPGRELFIVGGIGLDLIENGRLDVGDDQAVEVVEEAAIILWACLSTSTSSMGRILSFQRFMKLPENTS
jgi:hypothetical protein